MQAKQIWNKWNEGSAAKKAYRDLKMGTAKDIYDNLFSVQAEQKLPDPVQPIQEELDPYGQRLLQHVGTYFIYAQHHPHRFDADVGRYFELVHTGNGYFNMEGDLDLTVSSTSSISWPNVDSYRTQLPAKESTPQRIIGTSSLLNSDFQHTKFCAVRDDQRLVKLFEHCSLIRRNAVFEIEVLQKEPMYRRLRTKRDVAMTLRVDDGMWTEVSINQIMNVYRTVDNIRRDIQHVKSTTNNPIQNGEGGSSRGHLAVSLLVESNGLNGMWTILDMAGCERPVALAKEEICPDFDKKLTWNKFFQSHMKSQQQLVANQMFKDNISDVAETIAQGYFINESNNHFMAYLRSNDTATGTVNPQYGPLILACACIRRIN